MSARRFPFSVAALAAIGLLLVTGCAQHAAAIRVGSSSVSHSELTDEIEAYVKASTAMGQASDGDLTGEMLAGYDRTFVGQLVQQRVLAMLLMQVLEDEGLDVTDDDRSIVRQQLEQNPIYMNASQDLQTMAVEDNAVFHVLTRELPDPMAALEEALDQVDVQLSSKVGTWDDTWTLADMPSQMSPGRPAVIPPEGPLVQQDGAEIPEDLMFELPSG